MAFSNIIARIESEIEADINAHIAEVGTTLSAALIDATPFLRGQARANWQASLDVKNSHFIEFPKGRSSGRDDAKSKCAAVCASFDIRQHGSLWIFNNAPYIGKLNRGESSKVAPGFIETAIEQTRQRIGHG